jgi:hypothetical protein
MSTYTPKEEEKLIQVYTDSPSIETVRQLSVLLNKPQKSIISKLVRLGVYEKRGYRTKLGEVPIPKITIVRNIEEMLDTSLPDLTKAPKNTLKELEKSILELDRALEDAMATINARADDERVIKEMLTNK